MRIHCLTCPILVALALSACGGDDDGGGAGAQVDAGASADGGAGGSVDSEALGIRCTEEEPCPDTTPICATVGENPSEGFCTRGCAVTPSPDDLPGQEDHLQCVPGYGGEATPACAAPSDPQNGMTPWLCALACGPTTQVDFGTCPDNLVCDQPNPEQNGFCLPPA